MGQLDGGSDVCVNSPIMITDEIKVTELLENECIDEARQSENIDVITFKKTVDHLKAYPLVYETEDFINTIGILKLTLDNIKLALNKLDKLDLMQELSSAILFMDDLGIGLLIVIDVLFPSLRDTRYSTIQHKTKTIKSSIRDFGHSTKKSFKANIYDKGHEKILQFRTYYNLNGVEANNKPIFRSYFDPILYYINNLIENVTISNFPNGNKVRPDGYCCEASRTSALLFNLLMRIIKAVGINITKLFTQIKRYSKLSNDILLEEMQKESDINFYSSFDCLYRYMTRLRDNAVNKISKSEKKKYFQEHS